MGTARLVARMRLTNTQRYEADSSRNAENVPNADSCPWWMASLQRHVAQIRRFCISAAYSVRSAIARYGRWVARSLGGLARVKRQDDLTYSARHVLCPRGEFRSPAWDTEAAMEQAECITEAEITHFSELMGQG